MAKELNLKLPSADDLFSTQEERDDAKLEKVLDVPLSEIDSFPDHPFLVKMDESMQAMADSVKTFGIQTPAIVRLNEDGRYELISGHRRKMACELAGLEVLPCIIRQMSRDEAIIAMVDSNLQRETILPSEKAKSYKMKYEAMKRQAGRPSKENPRPVGANLISLRSDEQLAEKTDDSARQIQRFIRLNDLIPEVMQMVDNCKIAMRPAVELAEEMLMESLTFNEKSFDVIWSEGAIYNIGFEKGLSLWRKYLKDNGYIAVSEISWLTDTRPEEIEQYWVNAYSEIDTVKNKLAVIDKCGYEIVSHFALDDKCWIDNYYQPLIDNSEAFLKKYNYADEVKDFLEQGKIEADMYNRFKDYYSYVFYIARKKQ